MLLYDEVVRSLVALSHCRNDSGASVINYFNVSQPTCPMQLHVHHEHYRVARGGEVAGGAGAGGGSSAAQCTLGSGQSVLGALRRGPVAAKLLVDDVGFAVRAVDGSGPGARGRKPATPTLSASARKRKQPGDSDSEAEGEAGAGKQTSARSPADAFVDEGVAAMEAVALAAVRYGSALRMVLRYGPRLSLVNAQVSSQVLLGCTLLCVVSLLVLDLIKCPAPPSLPPPPPSSQIADLLEHYRLFQTRVNLTSPWKPDGPPTVCAQHYSPRMR